MKLQDWMGILSLVLAFSICRLSMRIRNRRIAMNSVAVKSDYLVFIDRTWTKYYSVNPQKQRRGQFMMNTLFRLRPDVYEKITGTPADCFYSDDEETLQLFTEEIGRLW